MIYSQLRPFVLEDTKICHSSKPKYIKDYTQYGFYFTALKGCFTAQVLHLGKQEHHLRGAEVNSYEDSSFF